MSVPLFASIFSHSVGCLFVLCGVLYCDIIPLLPRRTLDVTLDLKDPQYPDNDLGTLDLAVTLSPKEGDFREAVSQVFLSLSHSLSLAVSL